MTPYMMHFLLGTRRIISLIITRNFFMTRNKQPVTIGTNRMSISRDDGRDPFNQNSRNFGLKLNESVRSNRKCFEKSGPPFEVDNFSRLDWSKWTVPFDHYPRTSLFGISCVRNGGKYLSLHFYGLLTADLSVLLVHTYVQLPRVCGCFPSKLYALAVDGS